MRATMPAVLFDLDGTLVDSAPDLAGAANDVRAHHGQPPLPLEVLRPMTSAGARGMLKVAMGLNPGEEGFDDARALFLALYEQRLTRLTRVFPAVVPVLDRLDQLSVTWGIVTNKIERYTFPVVAGLGLSTRAGAVVCGDTTPRAKPHPDPLLEAARRINRAPAECIYVGDDLRDIQAGQAAGMRTVAVGWGYLGDGEPMHRWGADHCIEQPADLLKLIGVA